MIITNEKELSYDTKKEWLITNGIGGYASSTINGMNTRKYHALLVAALNDSFERYVVLSKLNEEIILNKGTYSISTNECPNYIEKGFKFQKAFAKEYLPEFYYNVHGVEIIKKIGMSHGENKVAITYTIKSNGNNVKLKLSPLVNFRNFHSVNNLYRASQEITENYVKVNLNSEHDLYMAISEGEYTQYYNTFYQNMYYNIEKERGFEFVESHFMPGFFEVDILKNQEKVIEFVAAVDDKNIKSNAMQIIRGEETRLQKYCKMFNATNDLEKDLAIAADNFIIEKKYGKTIIAGYHWFSDWGRDTFISLEGLLLKTNRFNDAKNIILTFSKYVKNGLIPNVIDEEGGKAYNSVDASLWYINSVYRYFKYTNDIDLLLKVFPILKEIIGAYKNGTEYNIKMDDDGLIMAGNKNTQLTWMDVKIGDYVPTPRYGKAVEINCLWYNALNIMNRFSEIVGEKFEDKDLINKVKKSFEKFYIEGNGLKDVIEPDSMQIRPNQICAISLDFPILENEKANEVVDVIERELLTPKGLKTLNKEDNEYRSQYGGDVFSRDSSYHQGTIWPYLLIGYYEACYKLRRKPLVLPDIEGMMYESCIGSINEIYDAEEPRKPKGAVAQAWSIAMAILNT